MRKVLYKKWIPKEYVEGGSLAWKPGMSCYQEDFVNEGLFHQWGVGYEEFESGPGNFTYAIVETPEGLIEEVLPCNLKFIPEAK